MNGKEIEKRLGTITSNLLREKGYISFVDIFIKLGYLTQSDYENWRNKKVPYLEKVIKSQLKKINFIMKTVRRNSLNGKLKTSWTAYKSWGRGKRLDLQFTRSGDPYIEKIYATHFIKQIGSSGKI
jgi:hypothetical protein